MATATFRFYEELNDFLPPARRKVPFEHAFEQRASVKDMIESMGVPHTEVDLILVNGRPVGFSHVVRPGERVSVYPEFESFDITPLQRLRPKPLRDPRFILDTHLGKLCKYIRLLGLDAIYDNTFEDEQIATLAHAEHRIILTRDVGLLKRKLVSHGYFVRATAPREQLREVYLRFDLRGLTVPFSRCVHCNARLLCVRGGDVAGAVPAAVLSRYDSFRLCPDCDRVFWQGSHYARMQAYIEELTASPG